MSAYYNEIDPYCAQWLRNLIAAGHIAPGDVDERSIVDVRPDDIRGYTQCHFFAGIGGWSYALRLAGWPDDRPVWTGSSPCQPFSAAGKGKAADDERHLWPAWASLIRECRPRTIFGEQVEAAIGWGWLDAVFADLEAEGYACGAAVLPACSVGAPHIRQRLWFVGHARGEPSQRGTRSIFGTEAPQRGARRADGCVADRSTDASEAGELADAECGGGHNRGRMHRGCAQEGEGGEAPIGGELREQAKGDCLTGELADAECPEWGPHGSPHRGNEHDALSQGQESPSGFGECGGMGNAAHNNGWSGERATQTGARPYGERRWGFAVAGTWHDLIWLPCTDGKQRPTQPGIFPLAHGVSARVAKLRAAGNAIVPQVAAQFIIASSGGGD